MKSLDAVQHFQIITVFCEELSRLLWMLTENLFQEKRN